MERRKEMISADTGASAPSVVRPITPTHSMECEVFTDAGREKQVKGVAYNRPTYHPPKLLNAMSKVFACPFLQTGVPLDSNGRSIVDAKGNFFHNKFKKYEARMNKQIKCKLQEVRAKMTVVKEVRATRSNNQMLDDFDEEAYNVEMTDIKRTPCYHMEDCLNMYHGDVIMLYFRCDARSTIRNVFQ